MHLLWGVHTPQNPLEVEEFLLESFPSHKNLRLFAENFVMTNDKYNKRPQDDKGGPQGVLICLFPPFLFSRSISRHEPRSKQNVICVRYLVFVRG